MFWPATIETERLVLRAWREDDAEALFAYASDPDVGPAAGWQAHASIDESRKVLERVLMVPETYAIVIKDREPADEAVGSISLMIGAASDLAIGSDEAELGYWIAKPLWGNGYMPEAVHAMMEHAFLDLRLSTIWAGYSDFNDRSRRVQEKAGLVHDRTIRNRPRTVMGDSVTEHVTKITREQWEIALKADPVDAATVCAQQDEAGRIASSLPRIASIRSGGQTGADRGALDAARAAQVPICGWCPPGGLAEDLPEPPGLLAAYPELRESASEGYVERTALNVRDSHATLIVAPAGIEPLSGTEMTVRFAEEYGRPHLIIRGTDGIGTAIAWLDELGRGITLNVAGPRESKTPGTYATTKAVVSALLELQERKLV